MPPRRWGTTLTIEGRVKLIKTIARVTAPAGLAFGIKIASWDGIRSKRVRLKNGVVVDLCELLEHLSDLTQR